MIEYGSGGSFTVTMDGPFSGGSGGGTTTEKLITIYTPASKWKGGTSPFSQVVEVDSININTKVDIQMSAQQLEALSDQTIAFTVDNEAGVVTLYAIGDKPATDCEFQATLKEVVNVTGDGITIIRGNTISTAMPRADYSQEDENKADFIKNKPVQDLNEALTKARDALPKAGGVMTGVLNMGQHVIEDLADPTKDRHAANMGFVKSHVRSFAETMRTFYSVTLSVNNWNDKKITVEAANVTADSDKCHVEVSANPESFKEYSEKIVRCESQGDGTLTFTCEDVPEKDLKVNISVWRIPE